LGFGGLRPRAILFVNALIADHGTIKSGGDRASSKDWCIFITVFQETGAF